MNTTIVDESLRRPLEFMLSSVEYAHGEPCMIERSVRQTGKSDDGDITALCNPGAPWSPVSKRDAIAQIDAGTHRYTVPWASGATQVHVVDGANGRYLRTDRDNSPTNNLSELPDCETAD